MRNLRAGTVAAILLVKATLFGGVSFLMHRSAPTATEMGPTTECIPCESECFPGDPCGDCG